MHGAIVCGFYHNKKIVDKESVTTPFTKGLMNYLGEEKESLSLQVVVSSLSITERYIILITAFVFL